MKSIPDELLAHYQSGSLTTAYGLRFTRTDGEVFAFTSLDRDIVVDGVSYIASPGANISAVASGGKFGIDNLEAQTLLDSAAITESDLLAGKWDAAEWQLIRFNWNAPNDGSPQSYEIVKAGKTGSVNQKRNTFVLELRGLAQSLQQTVGNITTQTCRWRLGDSRCGVVLGDFTVTGTITSVTNRYVVTDSARTEADDWFAEGEFTSTSGANNGLVRKVRAYASDTFTFAEAFPFSFAINDTYSVYAGCRKRKTEDCNAKFDNVRRFGGEPDLPGTDRLVRRPQV